MSSLCPLKIAYPHLVRAKRLKEIDGDNNSESEFSEPSTEESENEFYNLSHNSYFANRSRPLNANSRSNAINTRGSNSRTFSDRRKSKENKIDFQKEFKEFKNDIQFIFKKTKEMENTIKNIHDEFQNAKLEQEQEEELEEQLLNEALKQQNQNDINKEQKEEMKQNQKENIQLNEQGKVPEQKMNIDKKDIVNEPISISSNNVSKNIVQKLQDLIIVDQTTSILIKITLIILIIFLGIAIIEKLKKLFTTNKCKS